jgi:hypothetical protein
MRLSLLNRRQWNACQDHEFVVRPKTHAINYRRRMEAIPLSGKALPRLDEQFIAKMNLRIVSFPITFPAEPIWNLSKKVRWHSANSSEGALPPRRNR